MIFQKALSPAHTRFLVEGNQDTVAGYVVGAGEVAKLSAAQLFEAHGLGFPGSPFDPAAEFVDVLRFADPLPVYVTTPVAPEFVDHPPFKGHGFTAWEGGFAPLYFLDECRIPVESELWRVHADAREELVAVYRDVARGWTVLPTSGFAQPAARVPEVVMGWVAVWNGVRFSADVLVGGAEVMLAASTAPPAGVTGFRQTGRGCWGRIVPIGEVDEVFELLARCRFEGQPFRITAVAEQDGQRVFRLSYTGHDSGVAEGLGLNKADAGVYWTVVPETAVTDVEFVQNIPQNLPTRTTS
ncbi:hypothetical protein C4K88_07540 [Arthrobacter pityocampae]|uniref:Uncharacterized protein n=1 Tax=Arthrobacter pityocampae TaxID=547334 RepID=A0A2S5IYB2_9MICC|nr:hypothetical protein [Arthrobacter pityocampae]PPB49527.1 hypothetical protein C4K88_07500 [Arthrobacter pityocampae]PPB49535.1 hypothetical protein C4K88_07540 [Arthrobacter pityocampae]